MVVELLGETLTCSGFLRVFLYEKNLKTNMTSENLLVQKNTFVWKLTFSRLVFSLVHLNNQKFASTKFDSAGEAFPPPAPYVSYIKVGPKSGRFQRWRRDAKKGWVWGWGCSKKWNLHKNSGLPKSKFSVRENIAVERRLRLVFFFGWIAFLFWRCNAGRRFARVLTYKGPNFKHGFWQHFLQGLGSGYLICLVQY